MFRLLVTTYATTSLYTAPIFTSKSVAEAQTVSNRQPLIGEQVEPFILGAAMLAKALGGGVAAAGLGAAYGYYWYQT